MRAGDMLIGPQNNWHRLSALKRVQIELVRNEGCATPENSRTTHGADDLQSRLPTDVFP